jgi:O-antigen/teichoic acid export membrane protein
MIKKILKYKDHSDFKYLYRSGQYKLYKALSQFLASFILTWFLANFTSKEFFGNYRFILSILGMLIVFSLPGMKDAILQSVARGYDYSFIAGTKKAMKFSLSGGLVLILISIYYLLTERIEFGLVFIVCAIFFPFVHTLDGFYTFLNAKESFKKEFIYYCLTNSFMTVSVLLSMYLFGENLTAFMIVFFSSQLLFYLYFYLKFKSEIVDKKKDEELFTFGFFLTKINGLIQIANYIDQFVVGLFIGPTNLAIYAISIMLPNKTKAIINPIFYTMYPKFSTDEMNLTKKKILVIFLASCLIFIGLVAVIPIFIKILFSGYSDSIIYGQFFSATILFIPLNIVFGLFFRAKQRKSAIQNPIIISRVSTIILAFPSLYFLGIFGLILVKILEQALNLIGNLFYFMRLNKTILFINEECG